MFFPLQQSITFMISLRPNPVSFVHCQGLLRNLSMTLHTNRWHMAYFLCNFQGFPLRWAGRLLPNCWKNCSFHPFNGFLCRFLVFPLLWGAPSGKLLKKLQFPCFSHCRKASFSWFHCAKGTKKPSFFRPLPRFPAEFEHVTTYKPMAHGLFSLFFSAIFKVFLCFVRLLPNSW